ncbi:MAG TPA: LacI family DNA-binding transcriptional regulator, partial [Roseiarcus sp.]|nr:LacI family DNA-binding transcriptional regulator [Roseiarcus sp.]
MATTLHEVARRAGVSAMTVSRVVNGRGRVDSETRQRVEEAIQALDYVPNRIARGLIS